MRFIFIGLFVLLQSIVATAEVADKAAACSACHGVNGISSNGMWPNLAGQQEDYLAKEMRAFRDGSRQDASMPAALLAQMSDDDIAALAKHFSSMDRAKPAALEPASPGKNVRATCVSCHGMTGVTVTSLWPNLAAQKEAYLKKQLMDYQTGKRPHPIMQVIANELTQEQITAVAKYYSQH